MENIICNRIRERCKAMYVYRCKWSLGYCIFTQTTCHKPTDLNTHVCDECTGQLCTHAHIHVWSECTGLLCTNETYMYICDERTGSDLILGKSWCGSPSTAVTSDPRKGWIRRSLAVALFSGSGSKHFFKKSCADSERDEGMSGCCLCCPT